MLQDTYKKLLLFDFETTGLHASNDRIIEVGALLMVYNETAKKYQVHKELDVLINVGFPLDPRITEITNITDMMLIEQGVLETDAYNQFMELFDDEALLICYNLQFDIQFLEAWIKRMKHDESFEITQDVLDVMAIYKDRYPYPHRLSDAISQFNIPLDNSHRALDDIKATLLVLKMLMQEQNNVMKYVNVLGYNPKYGPSGKRLKHVKYVPQYGNRREIEKG